MLLFLNQLLRGGFLGFVVLVSCLVSAANEPVYHDDFSGDLSNWVIEQQAGGTVSIENESLVIHDKGGCTVWFAEALETPVKISYAATLSSEERVSDLNCFWMASDLDHPDDIFADGHGRAGAFAQYDDLQLYYVGYGGNHNSTTRFRRYEGRGVKPLRDGFDLTAERFLLKPDYRYKIELIASDGVVQYWRDGQKIFEFEDPEPLRRGWFGFRTVWSKLIIDDFLVERL